MQNDSKIPESEETPRPPLPSGPPPPIPSSSEKNPNFERSNPLSKTTREIGESMRKNYTQNSLKSPDSPKSGMSEGAYLDDESSDDSRGTKENQRFTSHNEVINYEKLIFFPSILSQIHQKQGSIHSFIIDCKSSIFAL